MASPTGMRRPLSSGFRTLIFLLFLSICGLNTLVSSESCATVRPEDVGLFFNSPQVPSPALSRCQPANTKACCSAAYTSQIDARTDGVHQKIVSHFLNLSPACSDLFDELACAYCSPDQGSYITPTPLSQDILHICASFCDRLYSACGTALLNSTRQTVANSYSSGKDFCGSDPSLFNVWLLDIVSAASSAPCFDSGNKACTVDDIVGEYTACDPVHNTRNLIYHWRQRPDGSHCTPGAVQLPQSLFGLRCDIACGAGQYLPMGQSQCSPCPAGTFSVGGGVRFDDWGDYNDPWPSKQQVTFVTYSQDSLSKQPKGNQWVKHGSYIDSGNNTAWADLESVLELTVTLVRDGNVTFEAKVDSEVGYDGLRLEINNQKHNLVNLSHQFKRVTFNLTKGLNVIRWVYYKDFSFSVGEDKAFINMIEVEGISYADDKCDTCPLGTFSPREGTAECIPCTTPGYIPFGDPPTNCAACPIGETALPYDSKCRPKLNCTRDDYEPRYSECRPTQPSFTRDLTWEWTAPHICDDRYLPLPSPQLGIPCEACNPGEQRGASAACDYCPDGYFSPNGSSCAQCQQGVAIKSQVHTKFQFPGSHTGVVAWPNGWSTGCDHCDTNGFRPHYDYIDSGDGEGLFSSWLEMDVEYYSAGRFELNVSMDCPFYDCSVRIWVDEFFADMDFSSGNSSYVHAFSVPIEPGAHKINIDFARWIPMYTNHEHTNTLAKIHSITFVGVKPGGATSCTTCPPGTVTSSDKTSCNKCPAGKVPSPAGICQNCPVNTITLDPGSSECIPCGAGTNTTGPGQRECKDNNCTFTAYLGSPSWPVSFNIAALASRTNMYGPFYAGSDRRSPYYFSMCTKASNSSCLNEDGTPMDSFACRQTWYNTYINSGRLLNFVYDPNTDPAEEKLVVQYTHGDVCNSFGVKRDVPELGQGQIMLSATKAERDQLLHKRDAQDERRRTTNITLICDPVAGIGSPVAHPGGLDRDCTLNFVWYSIYGCHICTENDYDYRYTSCENGHRTKVYYWKYNPKRCWGGVTMLPQDTTETCSNNNIVCPDGQYVSPKYDNCTTCPAGNFSVSGGEVVQWWTHESLEKYDFVATCTKANGDVDTSCDDGWAPEGINIASQGHMEGSAVLTTERQFLHEGSISFDFTLLTENEEPLQFFIDDVLVKSWNHTTMQGSSTYTANLRMGFHSFAWKFSPFMKQEKVRQAVIHSVTFRGLSYSESHCDSCPYPLVAQAPGSTSCAPCPANTVYKNSASCKPCPAGQYSLPGDSMCRNLPPCEASDFYQVFTPCVGGQRSSSWLPVQPQICTGTVPGLQNRTGIDCATCPAGLHRENVQGPCVSCTAGHYYEPNSRTCAAAPRGTAAVRAQEFFTGNDGTAFVYIPDSDGRKRALPAGWSTGCRGVCGTQGWRMLGDYMDSGLHFQQADSWVSYTTQLDSDGSISFLVNASSHYDIGPSVAAEFFIDNVPQPLHDLAAHVYTFPVSAGPHTFLWLHHQDQQSLRGDIRTEVSKIKILGTSTGGFVAYECPAGYSGAGGQYACQICKPGTYSTSPRPSQCSECPAGTFSSTPGATACIPCGAGTTPNNRTGATECINSCSFSANVTDTATNLVGSYTFDLSELNRHGPMVVHSGGPKTFTLQVCGKLSKSQSPCKSSGAFVCEDDSDLHESFEAGNLLSFTPNSAEPDSHNVAAGFVLEYSMGSSAGCPKARKTYLNFTCQMGATPYVATYVESTRQCEYRIDVHTQYACPVCNAFDLVKVTGTCEPTGERVIKYETLVPCVGAPSPQREKCSDVEVNEWAIVLSAGVVVVSTVALVTMAVYFWRKKTQSEQKYALLVQETTAPVEMQDFEDGDDEPSLSRA